MMNLRTAFYLSALALAACVSPEDGDDEVSTTTLDSTSYGDCVAAGAYNALLNINAGAPNDSYVHPSPGTCANKWAQVVVNASAAPTNGTNAATVIVTSWTLDNPNKQTECENSTFEVAYTPAGGAEHVLPTQQPSWWGPSNFCGGVAHNVDPITHVDHVFLTPLSFAIPMAASANIVSIRARATRGLAQNGWGYEAVTFKAAQAAPIH